MEYTKQTITNTSNIKLSHLKEDGYSWEIRMSGDDLKKVVEKIEEIDNSMIEKFKNKEGVQNLD